MVNLKRTKTKDGNLKYETIIGNKLISCYRAGKYTFAVHSKGSKSNHCTLKESELQEVFNECEKINQYGGDFIKYLESFRERTTRPNFYSKDGEVKAYFHKEKDGFIPKIRDHGVKAQLSPVVDSEEEALKIIKDVIDEYDSTGKYKRLLDKQTRVQLPNSYIHDNNIDAFQNNEDIFSTQSTLNNEYSSLVEYVLSKCDKKGNSLLKDKEKLLLCFNDNTFTTLRKKHNLKINMERTLFIINSKNRETLIPIINLRKVVFEKIK